MKSRRIAAVAALVIGFFAAELPADQGIQIIPVGNYDTLATGDRVINSTGGGVLLLDEPSMFVGRYAYQSIEPVQQPGDPTRFHAIEALYDGSKGRHRFLTLSKATSDSPVAGGWHTFQAASVYGYTILEGPRSSLTVGGGLALSDFGIETETGRTWPLLPVPFVQASFNSPLVELAFDFITGPNLTMVLAPERDLRLVADVRLDQFRDVQDILFEAALAYRLLSVGVANQSFSVDLAKEEKTVDIGSYTAFAEVDLTILTVSGGYAFAGWERRDDVLETDTGDGFFLSVQALLPLGGGDR